MLLNSILTAAAVYYCKMSVNATADDFFHKVKDTIGVEYKDVYQCSGWDFCRGAITIRIRDLYDADIKYNKDARTLRSIVHHINKSLAVPAGAILRTIQSEPVEAEPVEATAEMTEPVEPESVAVEPVDDVPEMIEPVATDETEILFPDGVEECDFWLGLLNVAYENGALDAVVKNEWFELDRDGRNIFITTPEGVVRISLYGEWAAHYPAEESCQDGVRYFHHNELTWTPPELWNALMDCMDGEAIPF